MSLNSSEKYLARRDPTLAEVIQRNGTISLQPARGYFEALASSIVSQQISVKAADKIFRRLAEATDLKPQAVLSLDDAAIKSIGLSGQKIRYLTDLAQHFIDDRTVFNHLSSLSDDEVIVELTRVKGVGVWTAQMFLIFTLHRPDIFAPDDRGLQLAIEKNYRSTISRRELDEFAKRWSPFRSTACLHLWQSLDNTPS